MPDLATHVIVQVCANQFLPSKRLASAALAGAVVPDVFKAATRYVDYYEKWWFYPTHSPLFLAVACYAISLLFRRDDRQTVFLGLWFGSLVHVALDLTQNSLISYYFVLFPFSFRTFSFDLFGPEDSLKALPLTLAVFIALFAIRRIRRA